MDAVQELFKINFAYVFVSVLTILGGTKVIVSLFEWVVNQLGIETKWMRDKRQEHELLIQTSQNLSALQEQHLHDMEKSDKRDEEITNDIKNLTLLFVDKQINDYRWEIINLADKISSGKTVSKECLRHAVSTYEKYEKIIDEHGLVNGEVEISMEIVNDAYKEMLKEGFNISG